MRTASTAVRVRYGEVDRMGATNSARYLEWFELGRTEVLRRAGVSYAELEERGVYAPVVEAFCRYLARVGYDDLLRIDTTLTVASPARLRFDFELIIETGDGEVAAADGYTENAVVDASGRVTRLPEDVLEALGGPA